MGINLSIKNAPKATVQRLKARAVRHHRSLQGELMAILESVAAEETRLDPAAVIAEVRRLGLQTPAESAVIVRRDRDGR
jgi:plasmid stability protein